MNSNKLDNSKLSSLSSSKSSNEKVKIALPTLCNYDDSDEDDEEEEKKLLEASAKLKNLTPSSGPTVATKPADAGAKKSSGLLGILPPPKANAFIAKNKASANDSTISKPTPSFLIPRTLKPTTTTAFVPKTSLEEVKTPSFSGLVDDQEPIETFSSLKKLKTSETEARPSNYQQYKYGKDPEIKFGDQDEDEDEDEEVDYSQAAHYIRTNEASSITAGASSSNSSNLLDQEAWVKLCGGKRKQTEPIEIYDVNASDIVGDNKAELMKQITDVVPASVGKDYFAGGSRKKHQITYLAYVAKERDQELRSMWAQNKFNKQQARQKYGF
jgi:hypothetical protein